MSLLIALEMALVCGAWDILPQCARIAIPHAQLAPTGSGFLSFGPCAFERVQPLQVSWGWRCDRTRLDERDEFGSTPRLRHFEFEGTRDPSAWIAVADSIIVTFSMPVTTASLDLMTNFVVRNLNVTTAAYPLGVLVPWREAETMI